VDQMHNLLKRQLKRYFGDQSRIPEGCQEFINAVNDAYRESDADREMLERALELSSQELLQANSEMRAIFQAIPDLLFRLDGDGTILSYEAGSTLPPFLTLQELLGTRIQDIPLKEVGDKFREAIQARETKSVVNIEFSLFVLGQRHYYEARLLPLLQNQIIVIVRDITERMQAEAEREVMIKALEAKNAELERFTYTVSHDLKSPLITIAGFVGFLEQDALVGNLERVKEDMIHINIAVARMNRLLGELLELSRVGRLVNPPEEVSFENIVHEAVELVRGRIEARGVKVEIAPDLPTVYGDRVRLVEVVQNLVDNACKFMGDQPQPHVEIGMHQAADGPVFYVRDNGIGVERQYQDQVFGLFDKLDPTSEGTGIGLALAKRIIETHGGKIWIESEGIGHGSTFCFILPPVR
jgi:signal transduction histidine kinase